MPTPAQEPLVTVVTPVYNGAKHIRECIESVLAQTYQNWEYIIVNNCSKDATPQIAREYAGKDPRVRVHDNAEFVSVHRNHNIAVQLVSPAAKYCKVVQADDIIFPACLSEMVRVAEEHPSVGLVTSYRLFGKYVDHGGLPYPTACVPGREICRRFFQNDLYLFGSPTATMIRADLIRRWNPFYNEENLHADTEACLQVLQDSDLGFVHQVLTFTRLHEDSITSRTASRMTTMYLGHFACLVKYGPRCLSEDEYRREFKRWLKFYYRGMARCLRRREFKALAYNANGLRQLGYRLSWARVAATMAWSGAEELVPGLGRVTKPVLDPGAGR